MLCHSEIHLKVWVFLEQLSHSNLIFFFYRNAAGIRHNSAHLSIFSLYRSFTGILLPFENYHHNSEASWCKRSTRTNAAAHGTAGIVCPQELEAQRASVRRSVLPDPLQPRGL